MFLDFFCKETRTTRQMVTDLLAVCALCARATAGRAQEKHKEADGANGTAGVNERGDVVIGTNRVYQIPINSGGTSMPVITPLAEPVSGSGNYVGQTAYPMAAQNNLEMLIDGASWMNAAAYTNAAFGQNYSGSAVGNE